MSEFWVKIITFLMSLTLSVSTYNPMGKLVNPYEKGLLFRGEVKERLINENSGIKALTAPKIVSNNTIVGSKWWIYPEEIKLTKRSGNDLLVLVNKEYRLPETFIPIDLVKASQSGIRRGESYYLRSILINDLRDLVNQASNDGVDLSIRSGYRSYADQLYTYNFWLKANGDIEDEADKVSARAGHSQHQLGTAIDFSSAEIQDGLGGQFSGTLAAKWLEQNAWKYGFVLAFPKGYENTTGYSYESWHYRYIGIANAKNVLNSGKILEVYLREIN